jgi:hypothetical protein
VQFVGLPQLVENLAVPAINQEGPKDR